MTENKGSAVPCINEISELNVSDMCTFVGFCFINADLFVKLTNNVVFLLKWTLKKLKKNNKEFAKQVALNLKHSAKD